MNSSGILKSVLFFLCVTLVVLLVMPKDCAKKAAGPLAALRHSRSGAAKGLRIETSTPAPASRNLAYPAGLDAARLQYLIEVDGHFAAPLTLTCPKRPGGYPLGSPRGARDVLALLHRIERAQIALHHGADGAPARRLRVSDFRKP